MPDWGLAVGDRVCQMDLYDGGEKEIPVCCSFFFFRVFFKGLDVQLDEREGLPQTGAA